MLEPTVGALKQEQDAGLTELPVRRFVEFESRNLNSWSRQHRVIGKTEVLAKGQNPRFVVTNFEVDDFEARALYEDFNCARGDIENRIKEQNRISLPTAPAPQQWLRNSCDFGSPLH